MPIMPCRRIAAALLTSLLLHLFVVGAWQAWLRIGKGDAPVMAAPIQVRIADAPQGRHDDNESLLKDTLAKGEVPHKPRPEAASGNGTADAVARRKISGHVFYPAAAIARGIEGEVRLLVVLDNAGNVTEVQIAGSSGYPILDQAALDAAHAMGHLDGAGARELILPVDFRLK